MAQAPITTKSTIIVQAFNSYIASVIKNDQITINHQLLYQKSNYTKKDLLLVEDEVKKYLYIFGFHISCLIFFPDHDKAFYFEESFNRFIEKSLKGVLIDEKRDEKPFYKDRGKEDRKIIFILEEEKEFNIFFDRIYA